MFKRSLSRAAIGTALVGAALLGTNLVSAASLTLVACSSGGQYRSCTASTTSAGTTPMIQYGRSVSVYADVSAQSGYEAKTPGGQLILPTGNVTFAVTTSSVGCSAPAGGASGLADYNSTTRRATYTFPASAEATCTYDVTATYGGDSVYAGSSDNAVHITVQPRLTTTTQPTKPTGAYEAIVTSDSSDSVQVVPADAGATFFFFNNSNDCTQFLGGTHPLPNTNQYSTRTATSVAAAATTRTYRWTGTAPTFGGTDYVALRYTGNNNFGASYSASCQTY